MSVVVCVFFFPLFRSIIGCGYNLICVFACSVFNTLCHFACVCWILSVGWKSKVSLLAIFLFVSFVNVIWYCLVRLCGISYCLHVFNHLFVF